MERPGSFVRVVVVNEGNPSPATVSPATVTITDTRAGLVVRPWLLGRHADAFEAHMKRLAVARLGGANSGSKAFRITHARAEHVISILTSDGFNVRNNTKKASRK